jgi:F420-dependent oxidoreductase-like protein
MRVSLCIETQQGSSYDEILALAMAAERHGFDGIYCSDHYLRMPAKAAPAGGLPGPTDAWTTLAGLARDTTSIRLGTLLTCATFRLPVPLAITVAQVDTMSRGRVVFGLGAGWVDLEHVVQGIAFPPAVERFDRLEEQLAIISGFWKTPVGSSFNYRGRYYRVVDSPALPKPCQLPTPPIVIGGSGRRRTPMLAAHFASEYNAPFLSMSRAVRQFDHVRRACETVMRDPAGLALSAGLIACCGFGPAEVASRAAQAGLDIGSDGVVSGTPDEVAEVLLSWRAAGAEHVYLEVLVSDLDHVELIGESVLPLLR